MLRVLVVDDEPDVRLAFRLLLEDRGLQVVEAQDARHALELVITFAPDVIVTDLHMPDLDGIELLMRAAAARPGLRAILITGGGPLDGTDQELDALPECSTSLSALLVLAKPVSGELLMATLQCLFASGGDAVDG